jgi:hypothetical protein
MRQALYGEAAVMRNLNKLEQLSADLRAVRKQLAEQYVEEFQAYLAAAEPAAASAAARPRRGSIRTRRRVRA